MDSIAWRMSAIILLGLLLWCGSIWADPQWADDNGYETPTLRCFANESELRAFLQRNKVDENTYITDTYDCDDFSRSLQRDALSSGYIMDVQTVYHNGVLHSINAVTIGNIRYWVEPQTDAVYKGSNLD